jgi:class 3 adenylate cyclase/tetratricopeptide (TPR) repeat protein
MKCPECQTENPETRKFCRECGAKLLIICPHCAFVNFPDDKFCGECGKRLEDIFAEEREVPEAEGERKHVTVLFSDLSGYTAMSEKLDPEEVKEITTNIFSQISNVIHKYEGFVEKFVGDAVMALFGVPKAHEDDPIRAIWAAREIHDLVEASSPEIRKRIGQPISMHTGINTGLVVTGQLDMEKGTHGVSGDTINLASRLSGLAKSGEILVGPDTYQQAEGHFIFEALEPTKVKGKAEPVQAHKVLTKKEKPITIRRLSGLRADLIGRKVELAELRGAVENLREGKGRIFSIYGDAGTGKSRLIEEFKDTLDLEEIQWIEGHVYAYAQNIPYFPLVDMLNRIFQIEEGDPPDRIKRKVESVVEDLVGKKEGVVPYIGSLYSLSYPEVEDVSPELWRSHLQEAIQTILSALAKRAPTIFFLEDLHWGDPSFVELLRNALLNIRQPAVVLCVYRPALSLFTSQHISGIGKFYKEIRLQDLSLSEAQDMLESLLKTETIPSDLKQFVQDKAEGNPFYLEELINSLIESETLIRDNGNWKITKPITESEISSTIHGLISGRLDRLDKETKRILQEASVIGRVFLYDILKRTTELEELIDQSLSTLERLDLIRTKSLQPDLEYMFKHALTQEVVYSALLKKDRQEIHEKIGLVMEQLFRKRLPEFYETLAFHFKRGKWSRKAVDYLMKSGEKSLKKYALEESDQYYREAFDILGIDSRKTKEDGILLIDLLIQWGWVLHLCGSYSELIDLYKAHENIAESLADKEKIGKFYAYLGFALNCRENHRDSYKYLFKALKLGEDVENDKLIGYACARLARTCADLGLLNDAIGFGKRAQRISRLQESDQELFIASLVEMGMVHYFRGESKQVDEVGKIFLDQGQKHSNPRYITLGYLNVGYGNMVAGNFSSAIECFEKMMHFSPDPMLSYVARTLLGFACVAEGEIQKAEKIIEEIMVIEDNLTFESVGTPAKGFLGIVLIAKGDLSGGMRIVEEVLRTFERNGSRYRQALMLLLIGRVYLRMVQRSEGKSLSLLAKNIGFLLKTIPFAGKKAENYFTKAIQLAAEIGAKSVLGQAYLDLGLLHKEKAKKDKAKECISMAIQLFEQCEAEVYLKQAKEALASLE